MKAYGISIAEGARITNVAVAAGESFPTNPDEGELFFRYDADTTIRGLHCFTGGTWDRVGSTDALTAPSGASFPGSANTGDLFYKNSNDAEEGLYVYNGSAWFAAASVPAPTYNVTGDVSGTLDGGTDTLSLTTTGKRTTTDWVFNNNGYAHSTNTNFNSVGFGKNFIQDITNGPGIPSATQYYSSYEGLGGDYPSSDYGMQLAIPRTPVGGNPYLSVRFREATTWGSWSKIYAGQADNATTFDGVSSNNTMINRGSVDVANQNTATANGFFLQNDPGASSGLLVFTPGGSIGTVQQRWTYQGAFEFRNKTDSSSWNAWKTVLTNSNASSVLNSISIDWTASQNFVGTGSVGLNTQSGTLVAYATSGNAATMSFHRAGNYAINLGLDPDNVFKIGGWSDGTSSYRLRLGSGGELTLGGAGGYIDSGRGLAGGYNTLTGGDTTNWGANIWGIGPSFIGTGGGTSFSAVTAYGLSWLRGTHASADSRIGEGLYVYQNSVLQGGVGTAGIYTDGSYFGVPGGSYGSIRVGGSTSGYTGVHMADGSNTVVGMFDSSGNGGTWDATYGWHYYWHRTNGCLGIGGSSTIAGYKARINGSIYVDSNIYATGKIDATIGATGVSTGITAINGDMTAFRAGGTTGVIYLTSGSGTYLYFNGSNFNLNGGGLICTGDITAFSDVRVKTNIEVIPNALAKVNELRGVTFNRIDEGYDPNRRYTGVIAQEVEKVLPEAVSENEEGANGEGGGIKTVAYGNMMGLMIEAIKELTARVEKLQAQLDARN